jgi:hypothetical protein
MLCTFCRYLGPLTSGLFQLKTDPYHPDRARYVHGSCRAMRPPTVVPARFLLACENGHLDDFPWHAFVHHGEGVCNGRLTLREVGMTGEAADILLRCESCKRTRRMADAFGEDVDPFLRICRGRRPHLRDLADGECAEQTKTILLGASNSWFPMTLTALAIPTATDRLGQLVADHWTVLEHAASRREVALLRTVGQLRAFLGYGDEDIWAAIEARRATPSQNNGDVGALKPPEWRVFVHPEEAPTTDDFQLRPVDPPPRLSHLFARVVLVERVREVKALIGFTRLQSPGDFDDGFDVPEQRQVRLSRHPPRWVPAVEVRGEGIFIHFDEQAIDGWLTRGDDVKEREAGFNQAHRAWWMRRAVDHPPPPPGLRYVLLHSFGHALMRQLAVECGYTLASIRERIYHQPPTDEQGAMAGLLIYTAAQDSEGTLGGLVSLGRPEELGRHIRLALERVGLCASDPLCAEHAPSPDGTSLHGAACHACLFIPETSCERGNRYLDRAVLVETVCPADLAFFDAGA